LVFGWIFVAHQIGGALAAFGAGWTRTLDGTYAPAFTVSGLLCVAAGLLSLWIGRGKGDEKPVHLQQSLAH
jgi:sugar phosphate permease